MDLNRIINSRGKKIIDICCVGSGVKCVGELPYGSQLTTPTCVVWSWRLKECYAILMSPKLSGCHCPGDMAVRMREVLSRPWVGACVPLALGLSCFANNFLPSHFYRLY